DYQPMSEVMFVTIGKNKGAGLLPMFGGLVVGSFLVKQLKGKDLTVDRTWKTLNAKQKKETPGINYFRIFLYTCIALAVYKYTSDYLPIDYFTNR
ncbi:16131_t:CDS:2, partial [Acaulospora morrowiae]